MPSHHHLRAMTAGAVVALVLATAAATVAGSVAASSTSGSAAKPSAAAPVAVPPVVGDTKTNLQKAFANEMNAKERYTSYARQADRDGYAAAAQLFRACAQAEQIHADRHVHAIAVLGGEARVLLDRVYAGTTAENLQASIESEDYEAKEFYPALLEQARADQEPDAVRSLTFALSAERDHERLLTAALANLELMPEARPIYVCAYCGRTVESLDFKKCPNCFTDSRKFIRVGEEGSPPAVSGGAGAASPRAPAAAATAGGEKTKPSATEPRK
jgi:rubrerythrin